MISLRWHLRIRRCLRAIGLGGVAAWMGRRRFKAIMERDGAEVVLSRILTALSDEESQ